MKFYREEGASRAKVYRRGSWGKRGHRSPGRDVPVITAIMTATSLCPEKQSLDLSLTELGMWILTPSQVNVWVIHKAVAGFKVINRQRPSVLDLAMAQQIATSKPPGPGEGAAAHRIGVGNIAVQHQLSSHFPPMYPPIFCCAPQACIQPDARGKTARSGSRIYSSWELPRSAA